MKNIFLILIFSVMIIYANGQGIIRGKVTDEKGETLIGAILYQQSNRANGTTTDLDGNFSLKISDSTEQKIIISLIGYKNAEDNVTLKGGQVLLRNYVLTSSSQQINEIEITAKAIKSKAYYIEKIKQNSPVTLDYVSTETMKKTGDASVVSAVTRVSGVSTNGDFYTVRGIGDRYVKTAINGSVIPTLDPFTNNIKLDIFPSSLVDNIIVTKTLNPDLPGDWAGAYLSVETKDYPEELSINIESSAGYNDQATFKEIITSQRSPTDWLGYDNGLRNLNHDNFVQAIMQPNQYQEFVALGLGPYYSSLGITEYNWGEGTSRGETYFKLGLVQLGLLAAAQIDDPNAYSNAKSLYQSGPYRSNAFTVINSNVPSSAQKFPVNWNIMTRKAPINFSQSLSIGNQVSLFKKPLGFILGFRYSSSNQYDPSAEENRIRYDGTLESSVTEKISREKNGWSGLLNLAYKFTPNNTLSMMFMPNITGSNKVRKSVDTRDPVNYVWTNNQFYEERSQLIYQVKSENYIPGIKMKIEGNASYTNGNSSAPDFKNLQYWQNPALNTYQIGGTIGDGVHRYYRYLSDDLFDSRLSAELPLKGKNGRDKKIKVGVSYLNNQKKSDQYDYNLFFGPNYTLLLYDDDINNLLNPGIFGFSQYTDPSGQQHTTINAYYSGSETPANHTFGHVKIYAGYAMIDYSLTERFRLSGGVRVEKADLRTDVVEFDSLNYPVNDSRRNYSSGNPIANPGILEETNFLPSVNGIYKLKVDEEKPFNLRVSYSQSIARPSIRELSDIANYDYDLRGFVFGNSDLKMVNIDNYDLRLEKYLNTADNVSVSFFYKNFKNHIELVKSGAYTWVNVDKSRVAGVELESKMKLNKNFSAILNLTFVYSHTEFVRNSIEITGSGIKQYIPQDLVKRPMFGQAPYVINGILNYTSDKTGITAALSYNIQGPRLVVATEKKEIPDVYELPRHVIDIKVSKALGKHFGISASVRDLLNSPVRRSYKFNSGWNQDYDNFRYGTNYALSFSYKL